MYIVRCPDSNPRKDWGERESKRARERHCLITVRLKVPCCRAFVSVCINNSFRELPRCIICFCDFSNSPSLYLPASSLINLNKISDFRESLRYYSTVLFLLNASHTTYSDSEEHLKVLTTLDYIFREQIIFTLYVICKFVDYSL